MTADAAALAGVAREAAALGAETALRWQQSPDLVVEEKAASDDLVSQADRATEAAVVEVLRRLRPDDEIRGEEGGSTPGSSGICWLVDPIDGTTSYLYGRDDWAISVAALGLDGQVVAAAVSEPARDRLTWAALGAGAWSEGRRLDALAQHDLSRALVELNLGRPDQRMRAPAVLEALTGRVRDVRRGGSAAAALAAVASGRADAAWLPGLQPWDCAAGILLVHETGSCVGDLQGLLGNRVPASGDVLAAAPRLWQPLCALIGTAFGATPATMEGGAVAQLVRARDS